MLFSYLQIKIETLKMEIKLFLQRALSHKIKFVSNIFSGIEGFYLSFILACLAKISVKYLLKAIAMDLIFPIIFLSTFNF